MAYSTVGIVNLALVRLGVKTITALTEDSAQAVAANAIWQYIRDDVLAARDWRFAKTRVALAKNASTPAYTYDYAYDLPSDFIRLCQRTEDDPSVYPLGAYSVNLSTGEIITRSKTYGYAIETLSDGSLVLLTDYDNSSDNLYITYIRRITDATKFSPPFISALAFRLAAELSLTRTESRAKFQDMMNLYEDALKKAEGLNRSMDYIDDIGNDDWQTVGR